MIKLVIFDLDGTLLNSIDDLGDSCNYILEQHGFPTHPLDAYRYFVGNGVGKLVERALPEKARNTDFIEEIRREFVAHYSLNAENKTAPYSGILDLLTALRNEGVMLAVASNKFISGTTALVSKYFGDYEFIAVLGQREGIPVKPDPRIVYDIIEISGIDKKDILYVGDTSVDMQTATNAGVKSIGVEWGFRPKSELIESGATYIIDNPLQIMDIVRENAN